MKHYKLKSIVSALKFDVLIPFSYLRTIFLSIAKRTKARRSVFTVPVAGTERNGQEVCTLMPDGGSTLSNPSTQCRLPTTSNTSKHSTAIKHPAGLMLRNTASSPCTPSPSTHRFRRLASIIVPMNTDNVARQCKKSNTITA